MIAKALSTLIVLLFPVIVLAGEPLTLISPTNSSTVSSSRLEWQMPSYSLYSSNPYRVQVDDDSSFSSINKDYYIDNTHYTPVLSLGTWYWRVKAKDISATWSDWSSVWSFMLTDSTPTPSPTSIPTPIPSSTPSPSPTSSTSLFTISNTPSQINSDQSFTVSVNLSLPDNPGTNFYLKGAFKKAGGSNYFGKTRVSGNWIKNGESYSSQYLITTDSSGNWSGNLDVKPDSEDSGFTGTDDYIFKVGRYKESDNPSVIWSNEVTIKINSVENSNQDGSRASSNPSSIKPSASSAVKSITTSSTKSKSSSSLIYRTASVAGASKSANESTNEAKVEVKAQKQTSLNIWAILGGIFILAGIGSLGFIYLRNRKTI